VAIVVVQNFRLEFRAKKSNADIGKTISAFRTAPVMRRQEQ
jgi:hypothetical protein